MDFKPVAWQERSGKGDPETPVASCLDFFRKMIEYKVGISGLDLLRHMTENDPDVTIVMITAYGSIATAIDTMKNGAQDYLFKPFDPEEAGIII